MNVACQCKYATKIPGSRKASILEFVYSYEVFIKLFIMKFYATLNLCVQFRNEWKILLTRSSHDLQMCSDVAHLSFLRFVYFRDNLNIVKPTDSENMTLH
jgi:hypothetical protein